MKSHLSMRVIKLLFTVLLVSGLIQMTACKSQSNKDKEAFLAKNWISVASIDFPGDTLPYLTDALELKKGGKMNWTMQGEVYPGTWEYISEGNQIHLSNESSNRIMARFKIMNESKQTLVLNNASLYPTTLIFVEKGSGLRYPDPDIGYTPMGEVLRRYDFNEILWKSENGGGGRRGDGIVYVLANGEAKKIEIIRRGKAGPIVWEVISDEEIEGKVIYKCNLKFEIDEDSGESKEVNRKGDFTISDSTLVLSIPELGNLIQRYKSY